ncbi:MAG: hypothetical protein Q8N99_02530 [Nanoarchaeota archaeon]|nr:hypothetical protein [Nanoarchaeota archaeon]
MNKKWLLGCALVFLILTLINLIYAQYSGGGGGLVYDIRHGSQLIVDFFVNWSEPFLIALFGGQDYTGYLLFEKLLIYIILFSFIFISLKNIDIFTDNKRVLIVVSAIVPLLSIRFISFEWLNTIIMQYQILGIAIAGIIPFLLYLFFLHNVSDSTTVRKIGWVFFIVIYFFLWATTTVESYGSIYLWTMLVSFVFLLMDGTIHRALIRQEYMKSANFGIEKALAQIDNDIQTINNSSLPQKAKEKHIKKLMKDREKLIKYMN